MIYTFSRILGLFVRPLTLLFIIKYEYNLSDEISIILVLVSTIITIFNCELHKYFYKDDNYNTYEYRLISHIILCVPIVIIYGVMTTNHYFLMFAIIIAIFEKICDELQRYYVIKHENYNWLKVCALRYYIPSLLLVLMVLLKFENKTVVFVFLLYYLITTFIIKKKWKITFNLKSLRMKFSIIDYILFIKDNHYLLLLYSLILSLPVVLIRNVLIFNNEDVDLFLLFFMIVFSVYSIIDAALFTPLKKYWLNKMVLKIDVYYRMIFIFLFVLVTINFQIYLIEYVLSIKMTEYQKKIYILLTLLMIAYSFLSPITQVIYWKLDTKKIIKYELAPLTGLVLVLFIPVELEIKLVFLLIYILLRSIINFYAIKKY